jgi:TRAP-type C4-dicarboxylate transport system substrate-binding protein
MLDRRRMLGTLVAGTAMMGLGLPALAQDKTKLRFSAVFSEQDIRAEMMKKLAAAVGDQFQMDLYYGGTLFKQTTEIIAIQRGNLEMGNVAP